MFRIVCCDDSAEDTLQLTEYLSELQEHYPIQIYTYSNGIDLIKDYQKKQFYDLLILDMRMEDMNGIEVAKEIRKVDESLPILIVTATVDYAVDGYLVNACRYLVKPVVKEDFLNAVRNTLDHLIQQRNSFFTFPSKNGTTKLMTEHIYYLESNIRTIQVVAEEGRFSFTGTISALEEELRPHGFIRIHKSFLVNISRVRNIFKESVTMDNQDVIPMSKHKRKDVSHEFLSYMEAHL